MEDIVFRSQGVLFEEQGLCSTQNDKTRRTVSLPSPEPLSYSTEI
jgi:hypothetical protein